MTGSADYVPPEVVLYQGQQMLARTESGGLFPRYIPCEGCGWLIGVGDAIDTTWHESCWARPEQFDGEAGG